MTDPQESQESHESHQEFSRRIGAKESRKLKARQGKDKGMWFGLGAMGTVGWSIVIPTLVGALLGRWLDGRLQGTVSWTLMLLLVGLAIGCLNAYHWVHKQGGTIGRSQDDDKH